MKIDNYLINAKKISANKDSNVITAHFASLKGGDQEIINAQRIELDVITKDLLYVQKSKSGNINSKP
ncbi:hypothetical protein WG904_10255 [Pedobacter sp. Du54]|uniref:hypothetical protein n=1 Tax=Pedobacter anseongensis TaxID=3133439 RepID=UPI0030A40E21